MFDFVHLFLAVDQNSCDSQILLSWPALKDFKINICNDDDSWKFEFKQQSKVTVLSSQQFIQELTLKAQVFKVKVTFNFYDNETDENEINNEISDIDLSNVPERLCLRYRNFFNVHKTEQQPPHWPTDHAIELKPDTESSYMCMYNMFSAELKVLDIYLNDALVKDWI